MSSKTKTNYGVMLDAASWTGSKATSTWDAIAKSPVGQHYSDMWNRAQRENALDADRGTDGDTNAVAQTIDTTRSRLTLHTPYPDATIMIGKPDDFGYPGISMHAENYWYVHV